MKDSMVIGTTQGFMYKGYNLDVVTGSILAQCTFEDCTFKGEYLRMTSCQFTDCDLSLLKYTIVEFSYLTNSLLGGVGVVPTVWTANSLETSNGVGWGGGVMSSGSSILVELSKLVPALMTEHASCPACMNLPSSPIGAVVQHGIADWLEELNVDLTIKPKGTVNA